MSKHYTVLVLDASSSMSSMRQEALDAFNEQLKDIRKASKDENLVSRVGFVKFASGVQDIDIWNKPIGKVKNLQKTDYRPGGMTAMLDGVGDTITKLMELEDIEDEDTSVLVNIISDGNENNSKRFTYADIASKIKELTDTGRWTFTYSGANQDLSVISKKMNINIGNTMSFDASSKGMKSSNLRRGRSMDNYFTSLKLQRDSGTLASSVSDFYSSTEDDDKQGGVEI